MTRQNNGNNNNNSRGRRTNGFRRNNHFNRGSRYNRNRNQNDYQSNKGQEMSKETNVPITYEKEDVKEEVAYKKIICKDHEDDEGEKEEIPIYNDGNLERFLKSCQEWNKATKGYTYMFNRENITKTARKFTKCFAGATDDDAVTKILDTTGALTEARFNSLKQEFIEEKCGQKAAVLQLRYLRRTPKPKAMTTAEWNRRIKYINSLIPLMDETSTPLSEDELITDVIEPNFPEYLEKKHRLSVPDSPSLNEVESTISLLIADNQQEKQHQNRQRERKNGQKNRSNGGKKFHTWWT